MNSPHDPDDTDPADDQDAETGRPPRPEWDLWAWDRDELGMDPSADPLFGLFEID